MYITGGNTALSCSVPQPQSPLMSSNHYLHHQPNPIPPRPHSLPHLFAHLQTPLPTTTPPLHMHKPPAPLACPSPDPTKSFPTAINPTYPSPSAPTHPPPQAIHPPPESPPQPPPNPPNPPLLAPTLALRPSPRPQDLAGSNPLPEPTIADVARAIAKLKGHKPLGTDSVLPEMLKYGGTAVAEALHGIILEAWQPEHAPPEFKRNVVIPRR